MSDDLTELLAAAETGNDEMLIKLEAIVIELLEKNPEKLLHALYRIDVDEKKFTAALKSSTGNPAHDIAVLLYERALEKAANKKNFPGSENIASEEKW